MSFALRGRTIVDTDTGAVVEIYRCIEDARERFRKIRKSLASVPDGGTISRPSEPSYVRDSRTTREGASRR